jgi:dienelactone hydrolase
MYRAGRVLFLVGAFLPCAAFATEPPLDGDGPYATMTSSNVSIPLAGQTLSVDLFVPQGAPPAPIIVGAHGLDSNKSSLDGWGPHLASWGFAVAIPSFLQTDNNAAPANAASENALLDWITTQGATPGSFYYGLVDGTRRGIFGHSMGGLVEDIASGSNPTIQAMVGFDPVDVNSVGAMAVPHMNAVPFILRASTQSLCNSAAPAEPAVIAAFTGPYLVLTVANTMHCDPCDPDDSVCDLACEYTPTGGRVSPNRAALATFRNYATAAFRYMLACDSEARSYIDGSGEQADVAAGTIIDVTIRNIPAPGGCVVGGGDAGVVPVLDAGSATGADAGGVETVQDSGTPAPGDAGAEETLDAGAAGQNDDGGGSAPDAAVLETQGVDAGAQTAAPGGCRCSGLEDLSPMALLGLLWIRRSTIRRRS